MAIQLAAYRIFGRQVATYEASQVRSFLHGRTETTRPVSMESAAFVKMMGLFVQNQEGLRCRETKLELNWNFYGRLQKVTLHICRKLPKVAVLIGTFSDYPWLLKRVTRLYLFFNISYTNVRRGGEFQLVHYQITQDPYNNKVQ
jgi:hypothetical protein